MKKQNGYEKKNSGKILLLRRWHPTPVLLPGKSHGRRSLVDCSPWGRKESDTTERLPFHFSLSCTGEGNGNPLQCSCLENPRDGGAWWAAVYGVTQSRTRLKWLSSSSSSTSLLNLCQLLCLFEFFYSCLIVKNLTTKKQRHQSERTSVTALKGSLKVFDDHKC